MKSEGLTSSRLAEILEIQPSGISHIVSGRNKPGFDLLQKILRRFPRINPDWLLLDAPNIYREESDTPLPSSVELGDLGGFDLFASHDSSLGSSSAAVSPKSGTTQESFERIISTENRGVKQGGNPLQNSPQNAPQFPPQNRHSSVSVERIIVLYSDHTFATYEMR